MKSIKINKSWFYSAGTKYGWEGDKRGVGIARELLISNPELEVEVDKKKYHLDSKTAIEAIIKYKSRMQIGRKVLGIVPKDLLKEI